VQLRGHGTEGTRSLGKADEEAGLRAEAHHHRQAQILRCRHPRRTAVWLSRAGTTSKQSSRELTPAGSAARTKTAAVQIARISTTVPVDSPSRLQCLLRSTPSSIAPRLQRISSWRLCCLAAKLACRLIRIMIEFWRPRRLTCQCRRRSKDWDHSFAWASDLPTLNGADFGRFGPVVLVSRLPTTILSARSTTATRIRSNDA